MAKKQPATKAEATKLAKELSVFLYENTGAIWVIRVWKNEQWHFALGSGTISIYPTYDKKWIYSVMNSGTLNISWVGHNELKLYKATSGKALLRCIKITLKDQKMLVQKYLDAFESNQFMKQFPK